MSNDTVELIPLSAVTESPKNPRTRFNQQALKDLAESIKDHGVVQPILVRVINKEAVMDGSAPHCIYEIVAGHRRWRASKIAEQDYIPCIVKDLDDVQTLKLQVIENLQREDLHPLEEAQGFQQLINATGTIKYEKWTPEVLAKNIGKSRSYVYESLNLLKLTDFAKDKFLEDKIGRQLALLISRIPGQKLQEQATKTIITCEYSYRAGKDFIKRDFTYDLTTAQWDLFDEKLIGTATSCKKCPKRSGNFPELFPDIESPDVCTDINCFKQKKSAYAEKVIKFSSRVIHGDEAKQIAPYGIEAYVTNGFTKDLDDIEVDGFTASEIFGDDAPEPIPFVDEKNNVSAVYNEEEIEQLAKARLAEKIATGELTPKEIKPEEKSEWRINQDIKEARAKQINPILKDYFIDRLRQLNELLSANDSDTATSFLDHIIDNCFQNDDIKDLVFDIFGHGHISEFSNIELLLALTLGNEFGHLELTAWGIKDKSLEIDSTLSLQLLDALKNLTGVALPPLPAAQAQELNAREETPATEAQAADAAAPVETSEEVSPAGLDLIEPAETAGNPTPAALAEEYNAPEAPLNNFEKIRLKEEAKRARKAARQAQKVSGQPDALSGADQEASATPAH